MNLDCTAKALTHRIAKIRAMAKGEGDAQDAQADKPKKVTKVAATPKKNGKGTKKQANSVTPPPASSNDGEYPTPPTTVRPKRGGAKRNYAEMVNGDGESDADADGDGDSDDGLDKRVKIEVGEDIGEGLRSLPGDGEDEDLDGAGFF